MFRVLVSMALLLALFFVTGCAFLEDANSAGDTRELAQNMMVADGIDPLTAPREVWDSYIEKAIKEKQTDTLWLGLEYALYFLLGKVGVTIATTSRGKENVANILSPRVPMKTKAASLAALTFGSRTPGHASVDERIEEIKYVRTTGRASEVLKPIAAVKGKLIDPFEDLEAKAAS
jgi:hypothetical protein